MDVEIWVPIVLFVSIAAVVYAFFYFRYRSRQDLQATLRQAIESGQQMSPELLARLGETRDPETADLRRGVIAITIGIGVGLFGVILGEQDAVRPLGAIASFPIVLGVAYLGLWRFSRQAG